MRNRGAAIIVREGKILVEKVFCYNRYFYTIPGGGIEAGEEPEDAVLREVKEECGVDGTIKRKLVTIHHADGGEEHIFLVDIGDQEPVRGYDPEFSMDEQIIKSIHWVKLNEISEKDRAFLWAYGLLEVDGFFDEIVTWGDEISYPESSER